MDQMPLSQQLFQADPPPLSKVCTNSFCSHIDLCHLNAGWAGWTGIISKGKSLMFPVFTLTYETSQHTDDTTDDIEEDTEDDEDDEDNIQVCSIYHFSWHTVC